MANTFVTTLLTCCILLPVATSAPKPPQNPRCAPFLPSHLDALEKGEKPEPLPIAKENFPATIRKVGYNIEEVRSGVYTVHDGVYFTMIVLKDTHLVLIDSPDSNLGTFNDSSTTLTAAAATEILNETVPSRIDIVYSHSHFDHIGTATRTKNVLGAKYPKAKFEVWASRGTLRSLLESQSAKAPLPTVVFKRRTVLRVGRHGNTLPILLKVIGGHTEDDVLAYFKPVRGERGVAFAVDLIVPSWAPGFYLAITQNVKQYVLVHDFLLQLDFDVFVGGHLTRTGTKKDIVINKAYALTVIRAAKEAIGKISQNPPDVGAADPNSRAFGNFFLSAGAFFNAVEKECEKIVIREWGCRLAAVDAVAKSNCVAARFFNQIDV